MVNMYMYMYVVKVFNEGTQADRKSILGLSDFEYSFNFDTNVSNSC